MWVTATKLAVVGLICGFVAAGLLRATGTTSTPDQQTAGEVYQEAVDGHGPSRCARFGADQQPGTRALVRRPDGAVALVSFKQAWEIYTGDRPGLFLELCLGR